MTVKTHKVTLREIARQAGVSIGMVSLILNGKGRASESVRTRVAELLAKSGHQPKFLRKPLIFLLDLPRIINAGKTNSVMRQIEGIEKTLEQNNVPFQVEFLSFNEGIAESVVIAQLTRVAARNPGGVFFGTDVRWRDKACGFFGTRGIPVMQVGYDTENTAYDAVVVDSFAGAYLAACHFIDNGHTRIATMRWQAGIASINSNKKHAGFRTALADASLPLPDEYVVSVPGAQDEEGWRPSRECVDLLMRMDQPPTALFVENSYISLSLLYPLAQDNGILPASIAGLPMVHFEDWPLDPVEDIVAGKLFYPRRTATVVAIDWEEIGRMAARMLIERVKGNTSGIGRVVRVNPVLQKIEGTLRTAIYSTKPQPSGESNESPVHRRHR